MLAFIIRYNLYIHIISLYKTLSRLIKHNLIEKKNTPYYAIPMRRHLEHFPELIY